MQHALTSTASTRAEWSKRSSPLTRPHNQIRGSDSEKCQGGFGGIRCHGGSFICRASPDAICCSVCKPKSEQGTWKDFHKYPLDGSFPSARNLSEYFRVCKKIAWQHMSSVFRVLYDLLWRSNSGMIWIPPKRFYFVFDIILTLICANVLIGTSS